jgi:DNA repair protein RadC
MKDSSGKKVQEIEVIYKRSKDCQKPKITNSQDAFNVFISEWNENHIDYKEEVKLLCLDRANKVLCILNISQGGTTGAIIDSKMVFQAALKVNAAAIILAHNHPSGNLKASNADISITKKIKDAGLVLDLPLHDHLIITSDNKYLSLSDEYLM